MPHDPTLHIPPKIHQSQHREYRYFFNGQEGDNEVFVQVKEDFLSTLPPPIDEFDTIMIFKVGERQYMSVHFEDDIANAIKLIRSQEFYNRNNSVFFDLHLL